MDLQTHLQMWEQMRTRHGITLRVIDQIPGDKLTSHPIPGMRTPVELVVHMYANVQMLAEAVLTGTIGESREKQVASGIANRDQLLLFVKGAWAAGDRIANQVTDAQLNGLVKTPWGEPFPGFAMFGFLYDEYLHHRGQLYAFLRVMGIEPVMLWDLDHNAPEFRPRALAKG